MFSFTDNDLEWFIREDNYELTQSEVVKDSSLTTWIYFDHRNYGSGEDIFDQLQNVFDADGDPLTGLKPEGSQYLTYDHDLQKMVVAFDVPGEQNGDDPQVVYNFFQAAMTNCIARGSTEFMALFSSHGGGFYGFGGDENAARKLTQINDNIVLALSTALENVPGAPEMYDVIGFDACLMQALGAADEYYRITNYFLASEAVEPGHGE